MSTRRVNSDDANDDEDNDEDDDEYGANADNGEYYDDGYFDDGYTDDGPTNNNNNYDNNDYNENYDDSRKYYNGKRRQASNCSECLCASGTALLAFIICSLIHYEDSLSHIFSIIRLL